MIGRAGGAWLLALLASGCHVPAYEAARQRVEQELQASCEGRTGLQLWAVGDQRYALTATCVKSWSQGPDGKRRAPTLETVSYLCSGGDCKPLVGAGNWLGRLWISPPQVAALPAPPARIAAAPAGEPVPAPAPTPPVASDPAALAIDAAIRKQIDARGAAFLGCANGETTVVQVELLPDRTTISLAGKHAGTPAEACARAALADLKLPGGVRAPLTVRHPVIAR